MDRYDIAEPFLYLVSGRDAYPGAFKLEKDKTIAVIGSREQVLPFLAMGASVYITDDKEDARGALIKFAEEKRPIILVSDELLRDMEDILDMFSLSSTPCITAIPGRSGRSSFYNDRINHIIKKAIGIDIKGLGEN